MLRRKVFLAGGDLVGAACRYAPDGRHGVHTDTHSCVSFLIGGYREGVQPGAIRMLPGHVLLKSRRTHSAIMDRNAHQAGLCWRLREPAVRPHGGHGGRRSSQRLLRRAPLGDGALYQARFNPREAAAQFRRTDRVSRRRRATSCSFAATAGSTKGFETQPTITQRMVLRTRPPAVLTPSRVRGAARKWRATPNVA
jgi:hypothetical protein